MTHSPGPWRTGSKHPCRVIADGHLVAYACEPQDEGTEYKEQIANARLIAAAPRMLQTLQAFVKAVEMFDGLSASDVRWWAAEARDSIAIATEEVQT